MAFERQLETGQARHLGGVAGRGEPELAAFDEALAGLDADHPAAVDAGCRETSQFWMMSAPRPVGAARVAPGDGVMPHRSAAPLQEAAVNGEARVVEIEKRHELAWTASRSSSSPSTPCMCMALPRRAKASRCGIGVDGG